MTISDFTSYPVAQLRAIITALESGSRPAGGVSHIEHGIPSLGGEHIADSGEFDFTNVRYVPEAYFRQLTRGIVNLGDILLVKDGATTGKVAFVREDFPFERAAVNEHVFIIRVDRDLVEPEYLFYFIRSSWGQYQIQRNFQGAAIGGINSTFVDRFEVPLPTLPEQDRILAILRELRGLRLLSSKATSRADSLYASFFNEMFGPAVPTATNSVKLGDLLQSPLASGFSPITSDSPPGIPVLGLGAITDFGIVIGEAKYYPMEDYVGRGADLQPNDILVTRGNTLELVGKAARYQGDPSPVIYPDLMIRVRLKNPDDSPYVENYLRGGFIRSAITRLARGTSGSMKKIDQGDIGNFDIYWPEESDRHEYGEIVKNIDSLRAQQSQQRHKLRLLEESTYARIFSGQATAAWAAHFSEEIRDAAVQRDIALGLSGEQPTLRDVVSGRITVAEREAIEERLSEGLKPILADMAHVNLFYESIQSLQASQAKWAEQFAQLTEPLKQLAPKFDIGPMLSNVASDAMLHFQTYFARLAAPNRSPIDALADQFMTIGGNVRLLNEKLAASLEPSAIQLMGAIAGSAQKSAEWPLKDHLRYGVLRQLGHYQQLIYRVFEHVGKLCTAEMIRDRTDLPMDTVRRELAVLASLGLILEVSLQAQSSEGPGYVAAYRLVSDTDESRVVDLGTLDETGPA